MNITQFWGKHYDKLKKYWWSFRSFRNWIGKRNHIDFNLENVFCVDDMIFMRKTQLQGELRIITQPNGKVADPFKTNEHLYRNRIEKGMFRCGKCKEKQPERKRTGYSSKTGWFCSGHENQFRRAYVETTQAKRRWAR